MMEHRLGRRIPVRIPVWLRFPDGDVCAATAVDISRGGMFVRSPARPDRNSCLRLIMKLPERLQESPVEIPAMVVHRSDGGFGLMFREIEGPVARMLDRLVLQSRPAPAARPAHAWPGVPSAPPTSRMSQASSGHHRS
jgi:hypothetical protein